MGILKFFEDEKNLVLEKLDLLNEAIQNLHYEGKMSLQKNVRIINKIVFHLKPILENHTHLDELVIFPFACKHIPILQPVINFLKAERNEFNAQMKSFEVLFNKFVQRNKSPVNYLLLEKLREKGIYVVCIVRNHMQTEGEGVYKVLDQKLQLIEKAKLSKFIKGYIKKSNWKYKEEMRNDLTQTT